MILYLSGAITENPSYMEDFSYAEKEVADAGHTPINPAAFHAKTHGLTYEQMMDVDMALLDMANGIVMLAGWEKSAGANREYGYALAKGLKVYALESLPNRYDQ